MKNKVYSMGMVIGSMSLSAIASPLLTELATKQAGETRLAAPTNISAAALATDSLEVSWDTVEGASGYTVSVWTNRVTGASDGTESWVDDFSNAIAGGTSSGAISSTTFNSSYSDTQGWECGAYIYPSTNNSAIRIGGADKTKGGVLASPPLSAGNWHLRMRAWRYRSEDGTEMPIMRVSAGSTSLVSVVSFTQEPAVSEEFVIELPTLNADDRLLFCSFTNKSPRVILDRVALVSGYSAGTFMPDVIREESVAGATSCAITNLPRSVSVFVGVTAIGENGTSSEMSESVQVDLAHPPPRAELNACPVSSLASRVYSQDFNSLAAISATTGDKAWLNGTTLPYWQAWQDGEAVTKFAYSGGNQTVAKFVALATNIAESARSFGARTRQGTTMTWGMAFTNDTDVTMILSRVSFSWQQWGFANTTNQAFAFECLVTNQLDWIVNFTDGWRVCDEAETEVFGDTPHDMPVSASVDYAPSNETRIAPGEVLYFKWTFLPPTKGASALMAIDDLGVAFEAVARPTLIRFVRTTHWWTDYVSSQ